MTRLEMDALKAALATPELSDWLVRKLITALGGAQTDFGRERASPPSENQALTLHLTPPFGSDEYGEELIPLELGLRSGAAHRVWFRETLLARYPQPGQTQPGQPPEFAPDAAFSVMCRLLRASREPGSSNEQLQGGARLMASVAAHSRWLSTQDGQTLARAVCGRWQRLQPLHGGDLSFSVTLPEKPDSFGDVTHVLALQNQRDRNFTLLTASGHLLLSDAQDQEFRTLMDINTRLHALEAQTYALSSQREQTAKNLRNVTGPGPWVR